MGYSKKLAKAALKQNNGNLNLAIESLLTPSPGNQPNPSPATSPKKTKKLQETPTQTSNLVTQTKSRPRTMLPPPQVFKGGAGVDLEVCVFFFVKACHNKLLKKTKR